MAIGRKSKRLLYKTAEFHNDDSNRTLQSLVRSALRRLKTIKERSQSIDIGGATKLLSYHSPYKAMLVGEVFEYTAGDIQTIAQIDPELEMLELGTLSPTDGNEFVNGLLYFGIKDNHVIVAQSMSFRTAQFEDYLNWLLRQSKQLNDEQFVSLNDRPPLKSTKTISDIRGLSISKPVEFQTSDSDAKRVSQTLVERIDTKSIKVKPAGTTWEAVKTFLMGDSELSKSLDATDIVLNKELTVTLELNWKRASHSDPTNLLDAVAHHLRHVDSEFDYKFRTNKGETITKDQLKLERPISVATTEGGLPRRDEMWPMMDSWITDLLEERKISSE